MRLFYRQMCDGKGHAQLMFRASLRDKMLPLFEKKESATLVDCQVHPGQRGGSDTLMTKNTKVQVSIKKFESIVVWLWYVKQ